MDREKAYELIKENIGNKNLIKHCLAVEAIMQGLAQEFNKREGKDTFSEEKWALAGLVHDIDYDKTADDPENHSRIGAEMLEEYGFGEDLVYAVKAHNDMHGLPLKTKMDIALFSSDPISGLIVAAALIKPEKKLKAIDTEFVLKRFKEKAFARGAKREQIMECEKLGFSLEEFCGIALASMQGRDKELGL